MRENPSLFGTDGIRERFGHGFFSKQNLTTTVSAIADWLVHVRNQRTVLLLRDTRASGKTIQTVIEAIFAAHGITIVDAGVMPTPAAPILLAKTGVAYAIVITASHNPASDNGIKIIDAQGDKISSDDESCITAAFYRLHKTAPGLDHCFTNTNRTLIHAYPAAAADYTNAIISLCAGLDLSAYSIVIDAAHGAYSSIAAPLLQTFGASVFVYHATPTGTNINLDCGAATPASLKKAHLLHPGSFAFAFDGDGDRVTSIDPDGNTIDGDDILWMLSQTEPYRSQPAVVGTIMSNEGLAQALTHHNKQLIRTSVGDRNVSCALKQHHLLLGGEPSGHVIMRDKNPISDGMLTMLAVIRAYQEQKQKKPLTKQFQAHQTVCCVPDQTDTIVAAISMIQQEHMHKFASCRMVIRPSGTEPLIRIMAEHPDQTVAVDCAFSIHSALTKLIAKHG